MSERTAIVESAPEPCAHCPWRKANQGKPHPHGWYSKKNLRRLWAGLRSGNAPGMTCHPTDPDNVVPDGATAAPEDIDTRECAGALILQAREMKRFEAECAAVDAAGEGDAIKQYRAKHPKGFTHGGLLSFVERVVFAGSPLGGPAIAVDLSLEDISHPDLNAWTKEEQDRHESVAK